VKHIKLLLGLIILGLILYGCAATEAPKDNTHIIIKARDSVDNGSVVPVSIGLPSPLTDQQSLEVQINDEVACTVTVSKGVSITHFSSRYRMKTSGTVTAVLKENGKMIDSAERSVTIKGYNDNPKDVGPNGTKHRLRTRERRVMMMFVNYMKPVDYIQRVTLKTEQGEVMFHNTLLMSALPYLSVTLTSYPGSITIEPVLGTI
jgi:hypothetical protein